MPDATELSEVFAKNKRFREATVGGVMELSGRPAWRPVCAANDFSLAYAVELIARLQTHRLAITNKHDKVVGVVTESMIIGWCFVNLDK